MSWTHFPHEADMGVRGMGMTVGEAFAEAAHAMIHLVTDAPVAQQECVEIECSAPNLELLFVDWLNALVYEMAIRRLLFSRFEVRIDRNRLHGKAWGETVDRARHQPVVEVKGATFTALRVARTSKGWVAECVVDI